MTVDHWIDGMRPLPSEIREMRLARRLVSAGIPHVVVGS